MLGPHRRRSLRLATGSFVVLVLMPVAYAAAALPSPSSPRPPCRPAAFTGGVVSFAGGSSALAPRCVRRKPPICRDLRGPRGRRGAKGAKGRRGARGARGRTGAAGAVGPAGSAGLIGPIGLTGATGPQGPPGVQGEVGATGPPGADGATGPTGPPGSDGLDGATGPPGATGPAGPQGPAGTSGLSEYAFVYNLGAEVVPLEGDVTFDSNGVSTSGITHALGGAGITLVNAGTYSVAFSVSGTEASQFALFVNGATLVPGSVYGSGAGTQQSTGQTIATFAAGDVLTLRNHTSAAAVGLATPIGGTQPSTNASVTIEQLA